MNNVVEFSPKTTRGILARWPFLQIRAVENEEAITIRGRAGPEGPSIEVAPGVSPESIDDPSVALLWLTPCLMQIGRDVLTSDLDAASSASLFDGRRWDDFRSVVEKFCTMTWEEIVEVARQEGIDFACEFIVESLTFESGLHRDLEDAA